MLRPLRNNILVRPIERKKSDVIFVVASEEPNIGIVEAVGPKAKDVAPGEVVRFGTAEDYLKYPQVRNAAGELFLVLSEADVCFVTEPA